MHINLHILENLMNESKLDRTEIQKFLNIVQSQALYVVVDVRSIVYDLNDVA